MKKSIIAALFVLSGALFLASCGEQAAPETKYNLTYHQTVEGDIEDYVFVVTAGKTTQQDAWDVEPDINPKTGYSAVWEDYNVEEMTGDLTIEPVYTAIQYTATFINRVTGGTLGTSRFTIEDEALSNIPALPTELGYTYAWESYTIGPNDMNVYCNREANIHTITFWNKDKSVKLGEQTFTIETESVTEPEITNVPDGYTGSWPSYNLKVDEDIDVVLVLTANEYFIQLTFEGEDVEDGLISYTVEDKWADLEKPAAPTKFGYTVSWPETVNFARASKSNPQKVEAVKVANVHTITFWNKGKTAKLGEQTFTIETESVTEPTLDPVDDGHGIAMEGYWPNYNLKGDQDIELEPEYDYHRYYLKFMCDDKQVGELVTYYKENTWADIQKPDVDDVKEGYTASWPVTTLLLAEKDNPQVVVADVTPNQYTVSYEGSATTTLVTYDAAYDLEEPSNVFTTWYYGDAAFPLSGEHWSIASDVALTKHINLRPNRVIDFENGQNAIISAHDHVDSIEVVDGEGVNGSKALAVNFSTSGHIDISRDYLDIVFADPNIKALSFYAKGTLETNNFRHIQVDQEVVHGSTTAFYCFESNISGYGISNNYKQFYLTRGVYEQMTASDWTIQYGESGEKTLYLDNFTTSYHDYFDAEVYGLENGRSRNVDENTYYLYNPIQNNVAQLLITGSSSFENAGVDYSAFTEGVRSVKLTKKSGQVNYYLRSDFQQSSLPTEGIYVDFKTDTKWNETWHETNGSIGAGSMGTGRDNRAVLYPFLVGAPTSRTGVQNNVSNGVGQWQTLHIKKSEITDDSRFLICSGSAVGNVFIDNIRLATEPIDSFENAYAYVGGLANNVAAGASSYPADAEIGSTPNVFSLCDYIFTTEWGNTEESSEPSAEITDERSSHGYCSLKIEMRKSAPLRLRPSYLQMLIREGGTLSFDVYSDDLADDKLSLTTLCGNVKDITKGQWTTITLTAADFLKDGQTSYSNAGRFTENAFGAGTIYIDNIRYTPAA